MILEDGDGVRYVYGLDFIAKIDGSSEDYYLADGLGSTTALTDDTGSVTVEYAYDAFGNYRPGEGSSDNEFTYAGEQVDSTGLQYLRARYYDAEVGRFLNQDPLPLRQRYAYVGNNPANYVDPSGLILHGRIRDVIVDTFDWLLTATYARRAPLTVRIENFFSDFSSGTRVSKEGGVTLISGCEGACELLSRLAGGNTTITIGHTIFRTTAVPIFPTTLAHEMRHVRQYETLGDLFLPLYFGNKAVAIIACGLSGTASESCRRGLELVEILAGPSR